MRLIDADAKELRQRININFGAVTRFIIKSILKDAPTIDAVPVVRCKDCKYWQDNNGGYPHDECCWGKGETPDQDDFCSYGERRDDDAAD